MTQTASCQVKRTKKKMLKEPEKEVCKSDGNSKKNHAHMLFEWQTLSSNTLKLHNRRSSFTVCAAKADNPIEQRNLKLLPGFHGKRGRRRTANKLRGSLLRREILSHETIEGLRKEKAG